jgi:hypothetical protein
MGVGEVGDVGEVAVIRRQVCPKSHAELGSASIVPRRPKF